MTPAAKNIGFSRRLFRLYLVVGIIGAVCSLPFLMSFIGKAVGGKTPEALPLPVIFVLGAVQQIITLAVLIALGLWFAGKIGLGEPLAEKWFAGDESARRDFIATLRYAVLTGAGVGVILSLLQIFVFLPFLPNLPLAAAAALPVWIRFGACFGGLVEEIILRLFLMSLLAWLLAKIRKGLSIESIIWTANVAAAIIFGLLHLPTASFFLPITPLVVAAALILNGAAGIAFGYLYWKRGLTAAMAAHFVCNIFVWVIAPELV